MDSYIGNSNCNDYRIGNITVKALYRGDTLVWSKSSPTAVTEVWVPLNDITNYQAFNAIGWPLGYDTPEWYGDLWTAEIPGVVSNEYDWTDGYSEDLGWFSQHRWNSHGWGGMYSCDFLHQSGYAPDIEPRADLPQQTVSVSGSSITLNVLEYHNFSG